jgi:D-sedoheptulose 7-phosphate isomerase
VCSSDLDTLVVFTTSGKSKNVLAAITQARQQGLHVILLTGENGVHMKGHADVVSAVPSSETARIQEIHELVFHSWCEFIDAHV